MKNIRFAIVAALLTAPFLVGAKGGCGGQVDIGVHDGGPAPDAGTDPCPTGYTPDGAGNCCKVGPDGTGTCIGHVDGGAPITCAPKDCGPAPGMPSYTCEDGSVGGFTGRCLPSADGKCGWEIRDCKPGATDAGPAPGGCVVTGCSGQICAETDTPSTCEWRDEYACYKKHGICQRSADGKCGWVETKELTSCLGTPTATVCGGFPGTPCAAGEYCHYEVADYCGFADATGTCRTKPEACTEEYAPVCGCDGKTYSNACTANGAGVSVQYVGECKK